MSSKSLWTICDSSFSPPFLFLSSKQILKQCAWRPLAKRVKPCWSSIMASSQVTFHNPHETDSGSGRSSSKPANRPSRCAVKSSQAVFLALSIILKVPIVSHDQNTSFGSDHIVAGRGASFLVSRSYESMQDSGSAPGEVKDGNLILPHVCPLTLLLPQYLQAKYIFRSPLRQAPKEGSS